MITRLKLSTVTQGLPKYRSMLAGNDYYEPYAFHSIASATGTGSSNTITFSSIPGTYRHLQLRMLLKNTNTSTTGFSSTRINFNSSTGSNYWGHYLLGNSTSVLVGSNVGLDTAFSCIACEISSTTSLANMMGMAIIDIYDYTSTTKNKTVRIFDGADTNSGTSRIALESASWSATPAAITSITITAGSSNFTSTSQFALYGIRGA